MKTLIPIDYAQPQSMDLVQNWGHQQCSKEGWVGINYLELYYQLFTTWYVNNAWNVSIIIYDK